MTLAVSLIAASFASTTVAATANLTLNGGTDSQGAKVTGATPLAVSPGKVAGFYVTVENDDTANLPTFFMTAASNAAPYGAYWYPTGTTDYRPCQTAPLKCDFGTFAAGSEVTVVAAFTLPDGTSSSTRNCYSEANHTGLQFGIEPTSDTFVCVDFKFASSQGNVPGKNKSRGDEFHWMDFVSTVVDPKNEAAQFPYCDASGTNLCDNGLLSLNDSTTLSSSPSRLNLQYTKVTVPAAAFDSSHATSAIHVKDGDSTLDFVCTGTCADQVAAGGGFVGETSLLEVNDGQVFTDDDWIVTTIGMLGVQANKIDGVVHQLDNGTFEVLGKCLTATGPTDTSSAGCFWVTSGSGNTAIVTVWTHTNGKLRNF